MRGTLCRMPWEAQPARQRHCSTLRSAAAIWIAIGTLLGSGTLTAADVTNTGDAAPFSRVGTAEALAAAVARGDVHIEITAHLDLTGLTLPRNQQAIFEPLTTTLSVRVCPQFQLNRSTPLLVD